MIGDRLTSNNLHASAAPYVALGFDPGAAHVGWCVLVLAPASVRYVASGVLEIEPSDAGLAALRGIAALRTEPDALRARP